MKKRVIHPGDLPSTPPVWASLVVVLVADRLHFGRTGWVVVGALLSFGWLGSLFNMFEERWTRLSELNDKEVK